MGQVNKAIQNYQEALSMYYNVYGTGSCEDYIAQILCNLGALYERHYNQAYVKVCEDGRP